VEIKVGTIHRLKNGKAWKRIYEARFFISLLWEISSPYKAFNESRKRVIQHTSNAPKNFEHFDKYVLDEKDQLIKVGHIKGACLYNNMWVSFKVF